MKNKKIINYARFVLLVGVLALPALASCNNTDKSESQSSSVTMHSVVFNYNFEGASAPMSIQVKDGLTVAKPTDPVRTDYVFDAWYTESACTNVYSFTVPVRTDFTLFAGWRQTIAVVTFDLNYDGGASTTENVAIGKTLAQPSNPTRSGYLFSGWYTESACANAYNFATEISGNLILYAGWEKDSGNAFEVNFYYNYDGNDKAYYTTQVNKGSKIKAPADPLREGYFFAGWYIDAVCTAAYNFNTLASANVSLYAKWLLKWTFEAEYTDLDNKVGCGYSANVMGADMIGKDTCNCGASNGFYVSYLYYDGAFLEFDVTAAEAVSDAAMVLRLSVEFYNMYRCGQ